MPEYKIPLIIFTKSKKVKKLILIKSAKNLFKGYGVNFLYGTSHTYHLLSYRIRNFYPGS